MDSLIRQTQDYYDSTDADEFHHQVWGGEDIHVGLYSKEIKSIRKACEFTTLRMIRLLPPIKKGMKILDLGAGYGGAARLIAAKYNCKIDCLNLSETENKRNSRKTKAADLEDLINITTGNFEQIPFDDDSYELVWSQDAFLHSLQKEKVFREVKRVLKPEGRFLFSDVLKSDSSPAGSLDKLPKGFPVQELLSIPQYRTLANRTSFEQVYLRVMPEHLLQHYTKVLALLNEQFDELSKKCSKEWLNNTKKGLDLWINAAQKGYLTWGILQFQKPNF